MAIFTLRDLLATPRPTIDLGDVVLSDFRRDASNTISPSQIVIETIEGSDPGIIVRTATPLTSSAAAQHFGFEFRASADTSIIEGASVTLSGGTSFSPTNSGGSIDLDVGQAGRDTDNITINLFNDNAAGVGDNLSDSDTIIGGPVDTFRFDYDLSLTPVSGVTATFTTSTLHFDLASEPPPPPTLPPGFDGLQYIASNPDLIAAFGANRAAGEAHYLSNGHSEGRDIDSFSETKYLQNYTDLRTAFGSNVQLATQHYIQNGFAEGRTDEAASPSQINGRQYIASHPDLIAAFGNNPSAGQAHYVNFGQAEGRALDTFDETQYLANYADLRAAFGNNTEAATVHYITFGFAEGRNDFIV
ncbi:MAG: hypothetical protein AB7I59_24125 [Geminicoccaceae bacterium]